MENTLTLMVVKTILRLSKKKQKNKVDIYKPTIKKESVGKDNVILSSAIFTGEVLANHFEGNSLKIFLNPSKVSESLFEIFFQFLLNLKIVITTIFAVAQHSSRLQK